jgi:hypothetical protein
MDDDQSALFAHRPDSLNLDEAWVVMKKMSARATESGSLKAVQLRSGCLGSDSLFQSSKLHLVWS